MRKTLVLFAVLFVCYLQSVAQPENPDADPDTVVPITGIEWLVGAGVALGLKKIMKSKKNTE